MFIFSVSKYYIIIRNNLQNTLPSSHTDFSFLEEPHDSMGTQGGAVAFSCEVSSNLDYSITWLHTSRNGMTSIVNSQASRFILTATNISNSMLHSLGINLLEYSDAGNYTCVAIVETNSISSSSAYLSVSGE